MNRGQKATHESKFSLSPPRGSQVSNSGLSDGDSYLYSPSHLTGLNLNLKHIHLREEKPKNDYFTPRVLDKKISIFLHSNTRFSPYDLKNNMDLN